MQENEIIDYLKAHPAFFEKNAHLLAQIHLPSPHGNGTISLAERQQLAQRDKITALEERYAELVNNAQENDKITNKMHQFFVLLQQAKNFDAVEQLISHNLTEDFNMTDTCLRIWTSPADSKDAANLVFSATPESIRSWVNDIHNVYCGETPASISIDDWFMVPAQSIAVLPLKNKAVYGYLALASDQQKRFYLGMGTDFLQKLGNHVSAALSRYLD
ncbi:MAG: DUF484 family protein [Methylophilaceae bacterium]|jgi:uncharacterized protein|nr:MAG: DUF484 family protein [Methylophilaceae bacterium]